MMVRLWLISAFLLCGLANFASSALSEIPPELADMIPHIHSQVYEAVKAMMSNAYGENSMHLDKLQALHQGVDGESQLVQAMNSIQIRPQASAPVINAPSRTGLTASCNNKLCAFFEKALSCKGIGIDMKQICAQYLLGFIFQCSDFPPASAFYQAPSVCLNQYLSFLGTLAPALQGQTSAVVASLTSFLYSNFSSNSCERRCYNKFRDYGNDLYQSCGAAITKLNATYPLAYALGQFSDFRNQGCDVNQAGSNCFEGLQTLLAGTQPDYLQPFSIFQFNCIYQTGAYADYQPFIQPGICSTFKSLGGCCAGSAIVLASQNQLPTGALKIFPPCLLTYLTGPACNISLTDLCRNQSVATQSTLQVTLFVIATALVQPVTTNNESVLYMMGSVSTALAYAGFAKQPYNFQGGFPFQVIVISNTTVAGGRNFALQLTMNNLNSTELAHLTASISPTNQVLTGVLSTAYKGTATLSVSGANPSLLLEPEPLVFSAAHGRGGGRGSVSSMVIAAVAVAVVGLLAAMVEGGWV